MNWKEVVKDYFTFSRKERIGLIVIATVLIVICVLPNAIRSMKPASIPTDTSWLALAKKLQDSAKVDNNASGDGPEPDRYHHEKSTPNNASTETAVLFEFDPNTLSPDGWKKLSLRDKTIATIRNYLEKGGHFNKPADLKKIYGFTERDFARLEPFVKVHENHNMEQRESPGQAPEKTWSAVPFKKEMPTVDINSADTSAFITLPGIGSKLAARIVAFREKLGGFYATSQVGEVYGLSDSTFRRIKNYLEVGSPVMIRKIDINTSTKDELKSHPYLRWPLANAIIEYRNQHGNFGSIDDLKKISLVTDSAFEKIKLYLAL